MKDLINNHLNQHTAKELSQKTGIPYQIINNKMNSITLFLLITLIILLTHKINLRPVYVEEVEEQLINPQESDEKIFYHPITGYSGDRYNMDAYIENRENETH